MHLLIPMSGQGTRYQKAGFTDPKPLIKVNSQTMIRRLLEVMPSHWTTHFVLASNHRETGLVEELRMLRPQAFIHFVEAHSLGPGKAIEKGLESIPEDEGILVSYCDYGMIWDPIHFEHFVTQSSCDACVVAYRGFHAHYISETPYAYCRMEGERVVEVKEKGSFTQDREREWASNGAYYFKSKQILKEALHAQKEFNLVLNGEYYTSLTVQALLQKYPAAHVRIFEIPYFFQWGTPEDLKRFEYWEKSFLNYSKFLAHPLEGVSQILVPMAGLGSRFSKHTSIPKPLLQVGHEPLFRRAISTFPQTSKKLFLGLESFQSRLEPLLQRGEKGYFLKQSPAGQALTTQRGLEYLDPKQDVIVTACDHMPVISPHTWEIFLREKKSIDAVVFTQRFFPEVNKTPQAYAYVKEAPRSSENELPRITEVSVKKTISQDPFRDAVLVGSFWFKNPSILSSYIDKLLKNKITVNGEYYLDSVINLFIEEGLVVKSFPLDGFICWGTPELVAEALYYEDVFLGRSSFVRPRFQDWK